MRQPSTMRALVFEGPRTLTVREIPVPEPGPDEVRVRVRYCGICGSDLSLYKTGALSGPDVVLGHEVAATVDLDPSGEWAPGTRVAPYPGGRGCGECVWCREGRPRYCLRHAGFHGGGFAEYAVVPRGDLIPVPVDLEDRAAAAAEPLGVAVRAVELATPDPGDLAYVSGLGPLGLFAVAALTGLGCRVVGADPLEDRRALGAELGCQVVLDPASGDPVAVTRELDPRGPRVALECAGAPESLQQVFEVCGHEGVVGILGIPTGPVFLLPMTLREQRAFSIQGPTPASMRRALELLRARPEVGKVVTDVVALDSAPEAIARQAEGRGGVKVLVAPGP
jgi:threonine dehydrogenase-like Zn-dependent dehydrogenase